MKGGAQELLRRRLVAAAAGLGATTLLAVSLSVEPGSARFYRLSLVSAGIYTVGGLAAGPIPLQATGGDPDARRRSVLGAVGVGVAAFLVFYAIALVARFIPILDRAIRSVLGYAHHGAMPLVALSTLTNGVAEEVYFRGAVYGVIQSTHGKSAVAWSTGTYALATAATRNPALVLASIVMGALLGLQRRASGGVLPPTITHLVWSMLMLRYLPPLFPLPEPDRQGAALGLS
jgi:hypothetical protein